MTETDAVRRRFAATAELLALHTDARADALRDRVRRFVALTGAERALDAGTGTGALAFALSSARPRSRRRRRRTRAARRSPQARRRAPERQLRRGKRDSAAVRATGSSTSPARSARSTTSRVRSSPSPSSTRVTRPGGLVLVVDQIAPVDPLAALELNRFERARDPTHARVLSDADQRALFDANNLVLRRADFDTQRRELDAVPRPRRLRGRGAGSRPRARRRRRLLPGDRRLVPARQARSPLSYSRHLTVQPTGGVSVVSGSRPSRVASMASRR